MGGDLYWSVLEILVEYLGEEKAVQVICECFEKDRIDLTHFNGNDLLKVRNRIIDLSGHIITDSASLEELRNKIKSL